MNLITSGGRIYDQDAIAAMGGAFDRAFAHLSDMAKKRPNMRSNLALCIIRFFDEGESNPLQLSRMALATNAFDDPVKWLDQDWNCRGIITAPIGEGWPIAF